MKLLSTTYVMILALLGLGCGTEKIERSSFDGEARASDQIASRVDGSLDEDGHLIIPNKIDESWSGQSLLGNDQYQLIALD